MMLREKPTPPELARFLDGWRTAWPAAARGLWHDLARGRWPEPTYPIGNPFLI